MNSAAPKRDAPSGGCNEYLFNIFAPPCRTGALKRETLTFFWYRIVPTRNIREPLFFMWNCISSPEGIRQSGFFF